MRSGLFRTLSALFLLLLSLSACGVLGPDGQANEPFYHLDGDGKPYTFTLEFRLPGSGEETAEGDAFPHSTIDGALVAAYTVPMFGNTVYESATEFFSRSDDELSFRLSQHRFYMFHELVCAGGRYNLETAYIAADGIYADCANFQSVLGPDGMAGTEDDLKILTVAIGGWLYY